MKILLAICFLLYAAASFSQSSYSEAIAQGDALTKQGQYKQALRKYFAAEAFDPSKRKTVEARLEKLFNIVEKQRENAEEEKRKSMRLEEKARRELRKNQKIIDALYFYDGKLALTQSFGRFGLSYGFINKNGDVVIDYVYSEATAFQQDGFARALVGAEKEVKMIKKSEGLRGGKYLLDTSGQRYLMAEEVAELHADIEALDWHEKGIKELPPIWTSTELKIALLGGNEIAELPDEMAALKKLKTLRLSENQLKDLPTWIGELSALETLELSANTISVLPASIGELKSMKYLGVEVNQLKALPAGITELESLEVLGLTANNISQLPPNIGQLKSLTALYLSSNNLSALPASVGELQALQVLHLYENKLTAFPTALYKLKQLRKLDLSRNPIPESEIEAARRAMPWCEIFY